LSSSKKHYTKKRDRLRNWQSVCKTK